MVYPDDFPNPEPLLNSLDDPTYRWYCVNMTEFPDHENEFVNVHDFIDAFVLSQDVEHSFHGGWADIAAIGRWSAELGREIPRGFLTRGQD